MKRLAALASLLLAAGAWADDPLKAPACEQALQQLQAARLARAADAEALRMQAARICLGQRQPPAAQRANRWAVPPIAMPSPMPPSPSPAAAPPAPAAKTQRPATVTSCDTTGCSTSDGARLQRVGPTVYGPAGACTVQGGFAYCP